MPGNSFMGMTFVVCMLVCLAAEFALTLATLPDKAVRDALSHSKNAVRCSKWIAGTGRGGVPTADPGIAPVRPSQAGSGTLR